MVEACFPNAPGILNDKEKPHVYSVGFIQEQRIRRSAGDAHIHWPSLREAKPPVRFPVYAHLWEYRWVFSIEAAGYGLLKTSAGTILTPC